ncbi:MAG: response regulator transcription factor [Nakamurella sp.]
MTAPSIALVDDHALVVQSLSAAFAQAGIECKAISPRAGEELIAEVVEAQPTLALLDLDLGPFGSSTPLIAPLTAADIRVVVLTGETDHIRLAEALEAGAIRIVPKSAAFSDLVDTIREVTVDPAIRRGPQAAALLTELAAHRKQESAARAPFDDLTARERETLTELAQGRTVHDIAMQWVVAETTVRSHVRSILTKLGVQSQLQAVVKAVHHGWIDPEPGAGQ